MEGLPKQTSDCAFSVGWEDWEWIVLSNLGQSDFIKNQFNQSEYTFCQKFCQKKFQAISLALRRRGRKLSDSALNQNKTIPVKMKQQNSSWSGYWKVEFWKFEDEWKSFCLAYILTSYPIKMILVPSMHLTIQPSKNSIEISSSLTSPRLRDNFFSLHSRNQPIRSLDFFIEKTENESLSLSRSQANQIAWKFFWQNFWQEKASDWLNCNWRLIHLLSLAQPTDLHNFNFFWAILKS